MSAQRTVIVSGIWPPDVGGPASHGPSVGRFLSARGVPVSAVVSADDPTGFGFPLTVLRRDRPVWDRIPRGLGGVLRGVRQADVVYATGIYHRVALAAALTRTPLAVKLVNDPAYERSRTRGWFDGTLEAFQEAQHGPQIRALQRLRDAALSRAAVIVVPSEYLARIARTWDLPADCITVVPNPADLPQPSADRETLRARLGLHRTTAVFVGRLVEQKDLPTLIASLDRVPDLDVVLVGDGPEEDDLRGRIAAAGLEGRVRLEPSADRQGVADWFSAADLSVLPSQWENFPHGAVESLSVGTPVVACAVGGVPEILRSAEYGTLVPPRDPAAFGEALRAITADSQRLPGMREAAAAAGRAYLPDVVLGQTAAAIDRAAKSRPSRS